MHRQVHGLGEKLEVINSLLDGMESEALILEILERVRLAVVPMFEHDDCTVLPLCNLTVNSQVRKVGDRS